MDRTSWAVYNPHNKSLEDLPIIFGFNNGGSREVNIARRLSIALPSNTR